MDKTIKELVLEQEKAGRIIFMTPYGPKSAHLDGFVRQPTEALLYDLNRDKATVLTFIDDQKWVNDYAVGMIIKKLKDIIAELESNERT